MKNRFCWVHLLLLNFGFISIFLNEFREMGWGNLTEYNRSLCILMMNWMYHSIKRNSIRSISITSFLLSCSLLTSLINQFDYGNVILGFFLQLWSCDSTIHPNIHYPLTPRFESEQFTQKIHLCFLERNFFISIQDTELTTSFSKIIDFNLSTNYCHVNRQ